MARRTRNGPTGFRLVIDDRQVQERIKGTSTRVKNALKRAARAALRVIREEAARRAPAARWQDPNRGYRTSVDTLQNFRGYRGGARFVDGSKQPRELVGWRVVGSLYSRFPGNIYEAGARAHWMPVDAHLRKWAKAHGRPDLVTGRGVWLNRNGRRWFVPFSLAPRLRKWAKAQGIEMRKALFIRQQPPRPFVIPAGLAATEQAKEAFRAVILDSVKG